MTTLYAWAQRHGVSYAALQDLKALMGAGPPVGSGNNPGFSEAGVQSRVRLAAPAYNMRLWRNNVGSLLDERGVPVRYGLANESPAMNREFKSSDLIGSTTRIVTPEMVGTQVAVFTALECKPSDWAYSGTAREVAQRRFMDLVVADGGIARFISSEKDL
jgi:hypothetical protein